MAGWRSFSRKLLWFVLAVVVLAATHSIWLGWAGAFLVNTDEPFKADMIVVLAGDWNGNRILTGADLVKQGYAPKVLVSGPVGYYGRSEDAMAIPFAVDHGYPAEWFIGFPHRSHSTEDEAVAIVPELKRLGVKRFILVTSDFHTRRAGRIYRRQASGLAMRVVGAPDKDFTPAGWWRTREGRKTTFLEWTKTITSPFGI